MLYRWIGKKYFRKVKEKIFEEKKYVEKCQQVRDLKCRSRESKKRTWVTQFFGMVWRFYSLRVSKDNLVSSIKNEDDDYEDNSSNVAEHHAIQRNVEDLNVNPPKKTKIEQWKSKKNVKVSKDLEQIEIIKELHEEMNAKNKRKRTIFQRNTKALF